MGITGQQIMDSGWTTPGGQKTPSGRKTPGGQAVSDWRRSRKENYHRLAMAGSVLLLLTSAVT
jgi:hypothetical protein